MSTKKYIVKQVIALGQLAKVFPDRTGNWGSDLGSVVNGGFSVDGVVVRLSVRGASTVSVTGDDRKIGDVYDKIRVEYPDLALVNEEKKPSGPGWGC